MNNIPNFSESIAEIVFILKMFFIGMSTYYTYLRIINHKDCFNKKLVLITLATFIIAIITGIIRYIASYFISIIIFVLTLSILYSILIKIQIGYSIIVTTVSLSINYVVFFISLVINFIPNIIFNIENDYLRLFFITVIHTLLLYLVFKIKRFKNGFDFIRGNMQNENFDILVLNICVIIIFVSIILSNLYRFTNMGINLILIIIIFSIIMFITIQKTLTMYYKHKMLVKDLNETKEELENMKKDRDKLEQENIRISKASHSISHKQKSLQRKLDKLIMNSETAGELDIKDRIDNISKEYSKNKAVVELSKTGIEIVDDMLECMRDECIENNIDFELQISGNIHYMTNNFVSRDELEILLADHIKDAMIAIQHSDNINRSILVRLGLIDEFYSLYIYDTGIEFEINTLINLGTKPVTTHTDEGGTGMGFLNTFDTLKKHKASMLINEIGKPCKDNYTKVIMIKFDEKNSFKVKSYRSTEIKEKDIKNMLKLT